MHFMESRYDQYHMYTIDWKHDRLTWLIDDVPVRTVYRENSSSPMTPPGERWFPSTPSQIQISIWGGGDSENWGTADWAGGPIDWNNNQYYFASYNNLSIQCYDDDDKPVPSWPNTIDTVSISYPPSNRLWSGADLDTVLSNGSIQKRFDSEYPPRPNSSCTISSILALLTFFSIVFHKHQIFISL